MNTELYVLFVSNRHISTKNKQAMHYFFYQFEVNKTLEQKKTFAIISQKTLYFVKFSMTFLTADRL